MTTALLNTKLYAPASRIQLVPRPRLMERLNAIVFPGVKLAVISAPAGSGKTTLVNQWLESQTGLPAAWVSLDKRDNLPELFFRYLVAAIQRVLPGIGSEALELLKLPGANLEEIVTLLANDLAAAPGPMILALDDLHTITNPVLLQALDLLVEAQPPQIRLVVLTREDPALHLAHRRARGQLIELRQSDLRFTLPEAVSFLNQCMDLRLSVEQVEILETNTEGWIAGLQMAALSLQHTKDVDQFIRGFSGSNRFILDYLLDEVFANQPEEIQHFLIETSILERMCAELCAALTGKKTIEAQTILEQLVRANLFVVSLDEERRWYRYHHLFNDLLLARLQREGPGRSILLYRKASDWYEENGEINLAVEYALKASDSSRAADLIERHVSERWQTADIEFLSLINRLPMQEIFERPSLCLHLAWVYVIRGQAERILPFIEAAEQQLAKPGREPAPGDETLIAFAEILRAYLADIQNQPAPEASSLAKHYAAIPESAIGMRNSVAVVIGTIHYMEGDFSTAMRYYQDAIERDKRTNGTNAVPICVKRMVWVLVKQGRLREAMALITENENYVRRRGSRRFYIAGVLNFCLGEILYEWNRLDEAETQVNEGLRLMNDWPNPQVLCLGYSLLARVQTAQGNIQGARETLQRVAELRENNRFHPEFLNIVEQAQLIFWTAEYNRPAFETFVREKRHLTELDSSFRYESQQIGLSRALLALGYNREAAQLLERLSASTGERNGSRITILALLAAAGHGDQTRADAAIAEALRLGEPENYLRTFVDCGEPLRRTLEAWLQNHQETVGESRRAYAQRILLAFEKPTSKEPKSAVGQGLPEPLSQREQEVLRLVAQGLTNQEIATRLVISIRTVKKHVENIHGKLGVQNRVQAAARGRALGLLDP